MNPGSTTPAFRRDDFTVNLNRVGFTIPAGPTGVTTGVTSTFVLTVVDDDLTELDETIDVVISIDGGNRQIRRLRIIDDDSAIMLSLDPLAVEEDSGTTAVTVTAAFAAGSDGRETATDVEVSVTDVTATAGEDYTAVETLTVTIPAFTSLGTNTFNFAVIDDTDIESAENETVTVSGTADGFTVTPRRWGSSTTKSRTTR